MTGKTLTLGNRSVTSLAVSADGTRLYATDRTNNVVLVIDASTGTSVASIPLNGPTDLIMSPDGATLFANGSDSIVSIDTASNSIRKTFQTIAAAGQRDATLGLAISPNGNLLATPAICQSFCNDGHDDEPAVYFVDAGNMTLTARVSIKNPGEPTNCATLPNDAVFTPTNRLLLWDSNCDNLYQMDSTTFVQLTSETVRLGRDDGSSVNFNNMLSFNSRTGRAYVIKEGTPGPGGQLVSAMGIIDPMQHTSSTVAGFNGTAFVPALTPDGGTLYVSVIHKGSGGDADTLDRYDTATNTFTRGVYTFTSCGRVRDMHILGSVTGSFSNGSIVPLYDDPTHPSWDAIVRAKQAHPTVEVIAVVNASNGPGVSVDPNYTNGITKLRSAGIKILGYVYTSGGKRTDVSVDIDRWKTLYPQVDGIFFDEMANTSGNETYYRDLTTYAKSTKGFTFTVGNPGTDTLPSYVGTVDVLLIYENAGLPSSSVLVSWHAQYDRSTFGVIPYGVASVDSNFVSNAKKTVKYQYLTDDGGPGSDGNPWNSLSSYFDSLLAALQ